MPPPSPSLSSHLVPRLPHLRAGVSGRRPAPPRFWPPPRPVPGCRPVPGRRSAQLSFRRPAPPLAATQLLAGAQPSSASGRPAPPLAAAQLLAGAQPNSASGRRPAQLSDAALPSSRSPSCPYLVKLLSQVTSSVLVPSCLSKYQNFTSAQEKHDHLKQTRISS